MQIDIEVTSMFSRYHADQYFGESRFFAGAGGGRFPKISVRFSTLFLRIHDPALLIFWLSSYPPSSNFNPFSLLSQANLASFERTPGPNQMSKQDEFDLGQFSSQKKFERELSKKTGLVVKEYVHNAAPAILYEHALKYEEGSFITSTGALAVSSGAKTGRSPADKRIVDEPIGW